MKISATQTGFALYKEADIIGQCGVTPTPKGADITALSVLPQWRRKGYGSYLLKEILRRFGGYDREAATYFIAGLVVIVGIIIAYIVIKKRYWFW